MPPLLKRDVKLGEGVNLQRWAVVKRIGDGGFAEVYEVTDTFKDDEKVRASEGIWLCSLTCSMSDVA
jgi:hypothetical protein